MSNPVLLPIKFDIEFQLGAPLVTTTLLKSRFAKKYVVLKSSKSAKIYVTYNFTDFPRLQIPYDIP